MPLITENRYIYANEGNPGTHSRFCEVVGGSWAHLRYPQDRKKWSYDAVFNLLVQRLGETLQLKKLTLILPSYFKLTYGLDTNTVIWSSLTDLITAHLDMAVEVVSLWRAEGETQSEDEGGRLFARYHAQVLARLKSLAPVVHIGTEYEPRGRWSVENASAVDIPSVANEAE